MNPESAGLVSHRLETAHLVVGYAMSRLDKKFLAAFGYRTWQAAFDDTARRLGARPKSIKGLRDEFDPLFPAGGRRGWADRKMLPSRTKVVAELAKVSDAALHPLPWRCLVRSMVQPELLSARLPAI